MKRIIAFFLMLSMVIIVIPLGCFAKTTEFSETKLAKANDLPFCDVKENHWFYEAVKFTYSEGIFKGANSAGTLFAPNRTMTRIEFVTTLFRISGADEADYTGDSGFPDISSKSWMSVPAKWASEMGYVLGNTKGEFMPGATLDRQTLATVLYRFVKDYYDTSDAKETALAKFNDASSVAPWAKESVTWATTVELINGTGKNVKGAPTLSPKMAASRAQVAQILMNYLNKNIGGAWPIGTLTLGGSDISEFSIVYGETAYYSNSRSAKEVADFLYNQIKAATGKELAIYADSEYAYADGAKEILIGKTNREDVDIVTVDREGFGNYTYVYEMQDDHLIFASNEEFLGTYYAATMFLEDILGIKYFGSGLASYTSMKQAVIEKGIKAMGDSYFEYTSNFADGGDDPFLGNFGEDVFVNASHNLPALACDGECGYDGNVIDYGHHTEHYLSSNPCLTADDKIDTVIKNVGLHLEQKLSSDKDRFAIIWLNQDDSATFCKCKQCMAAYRVWGRSGPYVQILTYVSNYYSAEYPNVHYASFSYRHTQSAPYTVDEVDDTKYQGYIEKYGDHKYVAPKDITPPENCVVMVKTDDTACASHAKTDPDCPRNVDYVERLSGWCKVFDNVCLHQFATGDSFCHTPFPNFYGIWQEYDLISDLPEVTWIRSVGLDSGDSADFENMRAYLFSKLYYNHEMTWNEYSSILNDYLKALYGPGWTFIREYIDTTEKLSEENHFWSYNKGNTSAWNDVITEEQWRNGNYEYCSELFDQALALCDTEQQRTEVKKASMAMRYIECQLAYRDYEASGSEVDFTKYTKLSAAYIAELNVLGLEAPEDWQYNQDPDSWHVA